MIWSGEVPVKLRTVISSSAPEEGSAELGGPEDVVASVVEDAVACSAALPGRS